MPQDLRVPMAPVLEAFGVPITVTRPLPDDGPINTTGVWLPPLPGQQPFGTEYGKVGPADTMGIPRTATLATLPKGSLVADQTTGRSWQVGNRVTDDAVDEFRVFLKPLSEVM